MEQITDMRCRFEKTLNTLRSTSLDSNTIIFKPNKIVKLQILYFHYMNQPKANYNRLNLCQLILVARSSSCYMNGVQSIYSLQWHIVGPCSM